MSPARSSATCIGAGTTCGVFVPLHGLMELQGVERQPVELLQGLTVRSARGEYRYDVQTARLPGRDDVWVHLVDCPAVFDRPSSIPMRRTSTCATWC